MCDQNKVTALHSLERDASRGRVNPPLQAPRKLPGKCPYPQTWQPSIVPESRDPSWGGTPAPLPPETTMHPRSDPKPQPGAGFLEFNGKQRVSRWPGATPLPGDSSIQAFLLSLPPRRGTSVSQRGRGRGVGRTRLAPGKKQGVGREG